MSQIKISVPHYDHVALRAMAKALEEIAAARAEEEGVEERMNHYNINIDTTQPGLSAARLRECANYLEPVAEVDTAGQQYESLNLDGRDVEKTAEMVRKVAPIVTTTDSTGTPWDERIHSASKALNSDGTWRVRRKPADKTPEEWADYVTRVVNEMVELKDDGVEEAVQRVIMTAHTSFDEHGPDAGGETDEPEQNTNEINTETLEGIEPPVTPAGDDFHVDAGVVTEQEVAAIPAPPLPVPPVPPVATVQEVDEMLGLEPDYTFPQVMKFLTERHARISSTQVEQIIREMGLSSIMDLNTQPEHTGPFIARVKAHLGE